MVRRALSSHTIAVTISSDCITYNIYIIGIYNVDYSCCIPRSVLNPKC